jgi:hypothetical protein
MNCKKIGLYLMLFILGVVSATAIVQTDFTVGKVPDLAKLNNNITVVTSLVAASDNVRASQEVSGTKYIYLEWYFTTIPSNAHMYNAQLSLEHREDGVNITVEWWNGASYVQVCDPPESPNSHTDINSTCNISSFITTAAKAQNVKIRLKLTQTGSCHEYLDWAYLQLKYRIPFCGDGIIDSGEQCELGNSESQQCGSADIGECSFGTETKYCNQDCTWGNYEGCNAIFSSAEICDGKDNDCDGSSDEDYNVGQACTNGLGVCQNFGHYVCSQDGLCTACDAIPGQATGQDNDCNGLDEDCNGVADNNYVPTGTTCGTGVCASIGQMVCVAGNLQDTCAPGTAAGQDDNCDGLDNNCDGSTDNNYVPTGTTCGTGVCASTGALVCNQGQITDTCVTGQPSGLDENCNGVDENCDGTADNKYAPLDTTCGIGVCASTGNTICLNAWVYDTCLPELSTGQDYDCNGLDDNCDGIVDNFYVPTNTECGQGVCHSNGQMICVAGNLQNTCIAGQSTGLDNNCNGIDENCDGIADNNYQPTCTECGVGVCASNGQMVCSNGVLDDTCTSGASSSEVCDGLDNDCDGSIDEDYNVGQACTNGLGVCQNSGQLVCSQNGLGTVCDAIPGQATGQDNDCNGINEDCDDFTDEHYQPTGTTCGTGVCASSGLLICENGHTSDTCTAGPQTGTDNNCNGIDEDCDGTADEHYVPTDTNCGLGVCASTGQMVCNDGVLDDTCSIGLTTGDDSDCDGLDDNCDGFTDNYYVPTPTSCGVGVCYANGQKNCVDGNFQDTCVAGTSTGLDNDCNGLDNDCDGATDEHYQATETTCGTGVCSSNGLLICENGHTSDTCTAGPQTGIDNNCNGIDENCNNVPDDNYMPTGTTCGIGACASNGLLVCELGITRDTCSPGAPTGDDIECNGVDEDCDGFTDNYYEPLGTTCGTGVCSASGQLVCVNGQTMDNCIARQPTGQDNECDGVDQNCDGAPDNNYVSYTTTCGTGVCAAYGQMICIQGILDDTCAVGQSSDEVCDGLDNDCDGQADEDLKQDCSNVCFCGEEVCVDGEWTGCSAQTMPTNYNEPCTVGVGACEAHGYISCNGECNAVPGTPGDEVCDGVDNDCDDTVDELYPDLGDECISGFGVCETPGEYVCSQDGFGTVCNAQAGQGSQETCDGLDNDCDDAVDEDFENLGDCCSVGLGVCQDDGYFVCSEDGFGTVCDAVAQEPTGRDNNCNNLDEDCNGVADNNYVSSPTECGIGICASNGQKQCVQGQEIDSCEAGDPSDELCSDQLDNDCDSYTDCADADCSLDSVCIPDCSQDSDCGTDSLVGEPYCVEGNLYQLEGIYTCHNPGTLDAYCDYDEDPIIDLCDYGCAEGDCLPEPECFDDDDCSEDYTGEAYCYDGDAYHNVYTYTCENPGLQNAFCDEDITQEKDEECAYQCIGGRCTDDSCDDDSECGINGYTGNKYCVDGDLFQDYRTYECKEPDTGICTVDSVNYCYHEDEPDKLEECAFGCEEGACIETCEIDEDCNDEIFCNGEETCVEGYCEAGESPDCDDENECTNDYCSSETDSCVNNPAEYGTECGESRDCQENTCENRYLLIFPADLHDFCDGEGVCLEYSCESTGSECNTQCGATCESSEDCQCIGETGCYDADEDGNYDDFVDYTSYGICNACACDINEEQPCGKTVTVDDNERCPDSCEHGETRACYKREGVCTGATETCVEGQWSGCDYEDIPDYGTEICDGKDNDCDGITDENQDNLALTQQCGQTDIGACSYGTQTCVDGSWNSCSGAVYPVTEVCGNDADDDCDGNINNGCGSSSGSSGGSFRSGSGYFEDEDEDGFTADKDCDDKYNKTYPGANELCDGKDNDCNGNIDEEPESLCGYFACPTNGCSKETCEEQMTVYDARYARSTCVDGECQANQCTYTCKDDASCVIEIPEPQNETEETGLAAVTGEPIQKKGKPWWALVVSLLFIALLIFLFGTNLYMYKPGNGKKKKYFIFF